MIGPSCKPVRTLTPVELANKFMDARFLLAIHGMLTDAESVKVLRRIEKYAKNNDLESKPAWMKDDERPI